MTKKTSVLVGTIDCPICFSNSEVRQTPGKSFKLIYCPHCGRVQTSVPGQSQGYRDMVDDKMRPIIENEKPASNDPVSVIDSQPIVEAVEQTEQAAANDEKPGGAFWPWESNDAD